MDWTDRPGHVIARALRTMIIIGGPSSITIEHGSNEATFQRPAKHTHYTGSKCEFDDWVLSPCSRVLSSDPSRV